MKHTTSGGRRTRSLVLTVTLLLGLVLPIVSMPIFAADGGHEHVHKVNDAAGGREGPLGGDEECGYAEGAPREHIHNEDCGYTEDENGDELTPCEHEHKVNDASGGREGPLEGDEDCGYIEPSPCTYVGPESETGEDDGGPSLGQSGIATPTSLTAFAPLDDTIRWQGFDAGTVDLADIVLPDTLEATDEDDVPLTVEGVTWACTDPDTGFDADADGLYTFTAELPQAYTLADGVEPPQITVIVRPEGGMAIMPMKLTDDLAEGTWNGTGGHRWVEFGGILWRVLEVTTSNGSDGNTSGNKTAFLLAEDFVATRRFDGSSNNWNTSDIYEWLNSEGSYSGGGFLDDTFTTQLEKDAILTTSYTYGGSNSGSNTTGQSKVFLLSVDEANNTAYFADDADRAASDDWWLRSPGDLTPNAAYVSNIGNVESGGVSVSNQLDIRPALKVNLASDIFTSDDLRYTVTVTVEDGGNSSPIAGASVSISGASASDAKISDLDGQATFFPVADGQNTITVTRGGYKPYTGDLIISASNTNIIVPLEEDTVSMPETVEFGSYNSSAVHWRVIDFAPSKPSALLLADDYLMDGTWQDVTDWINDSGGFLADFTIGEQDAMLPHATENTNMFLLSENEVNAHLPNELMRTFPDGNTTHWWLRNNVSNVFFSIIENATGNLQTQQLASSSSYDARPGVWVDLNKLVQREDSGDVTLVPAYTATVRVEDAGGQAINGANVTLTLTSGETYRLWDGAALNLDGTTSSDSADFNLPAGTYEVTATASGHTQQSGTVTLTVGSGGNAATVVMDEDDTTAPSVVNVTPSGSGAAVGGSIKIVFSETMNIANPGTVTLTGGAGAANATGAWSTTTYANDTYTVGYSGLAFSTTYTISITGFEDLASNLMNPPVTPYTFTTAAQAADKPVASPPGGAYTTAQTVTLTSATPGAAIYYTLDGSDPIADPNSARQAYSSPITVPLDTTLKAYATAPGWADSAVMEEVYTQAATYTLTVINGTDQTYSGPYTAGTPVQVSANIPTGATFTGWTSNAGGTFSNASHKDTTFTMPATNVTITATYSSGGDGGGNGGSTEKPAPKTQLPASAFSWDGERTLTINHDSVTTLGLLSVQWDGRPLTRGTDYTVHQGSVIIRFSEDFMAAQAPGDHTVRVEFLNHTGETTIKLTADTGATDTGTDTHNPSTGGDGGGYTGINDNPNTGDGRGIWFALLLGSIGAAVLVKLRLILRVKEK